MTAAARRTHRSGGSSGSPGWWCLLLVTVVGIGAVDAALLQAAQTYFTGGFNSRYLAGPGMVAAFLGTSVVVDAAWTLGVWLLLVPALRRLGSPPLTTAVLAGASALALPLAASFSLYELHRVLGNMASLYLLWEVSGRSFGQMLAEAIPHLPAVATFLAPVVALTAVFAWLAARAGRRYPALAARFEPPGTGALLRAFGACLALGCALLLVASATSPTLAFGLGWKPSAMLVSRLIERATDLDGDGFHLLSTLSDPDPTDGDIHPWALDVPGNGVDEDGMAGDHPVGHEPLPLAARVESEGPRRPHFLLVLLESFRYDLLEMRVEGREVTPFLNSLAHAAALSQQVYAHSPNTASSRSHLFSGTRTPHPGDPTLIDDFARRGYTVAHFSGQDDSFNDSERLMGTERADVFYDARDDVDRRISRATSSGGLQISADLLNERVAAFLADYDWSRPLFLYVNFTDTHFPYQHDELENRLGVTVLERNEISAGRAAAVRTTYANAAANVDAAVETLVEHWRAAMGDADFALLVTSDHGQSLYEAGFLGHGQDVVAAQTRTPVIVDGVGGRWPEPLGQSDLRGLLLRDLFEARHEARPRTRFAPVAGRRVLLAVPSSERPLVLALRGVDGMATYDLRTREVRVFDADEQPVDTPPAERERWLREIVEAWEADRLAASRPPG